MTVGSKADLLKLVPELVVGGQGAIEWANCTAVEHEAHNLYSDSDSNVDLDGEDDGEEDGDELDSGDSTEDSDGEHGGVAYQDKYECEGFALP